MRNKDSKGPLPPSHPQGKNKDIERFGRFWKLPILLINFLKVKVIRIDFQTFALARAWSIS